MKLNFVLLVFFIFTTHFTSASESQKSHFDSLESSIGQKGVFPLESLNDSLRIYVENGDSLNVANISYLLGKYYVVRTYDYPLAYNYFFRAYNNFRRLNLVKNEGKSEMQIGLIYYIQKNYEEAIHYFNSGYKKLLIVGDSVRAGRVAYLLGLTYSENMEHEKSARFLNIARQYAMKNNKAQSLREFQNGMGQYYLNLKNGDSALYYILPYYKNAVDSNDIGSIQRYGADVALAYYLKNDLFETEKYARQVLSYKKNVNTGKAFMTCYNLLYKISLVKGKFKEAIDYQDKYIQMKDSIINEKNLFDLASLNTKLTLENERKENELREAKQKEKIIEEQKRARLYQIIAGSFLLIVIISIVALLDSRRKKKQIESVQQQMINQEKLASMGKLTAGIAHEMLNPLNFISGFSKGTFEMLEEIKGNQTEKDKIETVDTAKNLLHKISDHAVRMEASVHQILNHVRISPGKKELTSVNELCNTYLNIFINSMTLQNGNLRYEITKDYSPNMPPICINSQEIGRVLMNIFNNAFLAIEDKLKIEKFSPQIKITTFFENKICYIDITDNGIGIKKEIRDKIFDHFFTTRLPGKGVGLGLSVANDIVRSYGGEIHVISVPMEATTIKIGLPC